MVSVDNEAAVRAMPGVVALEVVELSRITVEDAEVMETGVAVVAETFGQALDAKEALVVTWDPGPLAREDDASIRAKLRGINPPLATIADELGLAEEAVKAHVVHVWCRSRGSRSRCSARGGRPAARRRRRERCLHARRSRAPRRGWRRSR